MNLEMKRYPARPSTIFSFICVRVLFLFLCLSLAVGFESPTKIISRDKDIPCEWSGISRIVAVGDLHGAYEHFVEILKGTGIVDENLHWIGGDTHLVQIGDVLDRGDKPKDIFDLVIKLEKESEAAGGKVHLMIGNHEEMNLANTAFDREGYITPEQFVSFLPDSYKLKQEIRFKRKIQFQSPENSTSFEAIKNEWQEIIDKALGVPRSFGRISYFKNLNALYGDWILTHNVIIKINDIVFVHGGITESFSSWPLQKINETFRVELDDIRQAVIRNQEPKIPAYNRQLYNEPEGPLWSRLLAREESEDLKDDVERILKNLQANYIVIAHTPRTRVGVEEMNKYDGKVWIIDTGIADYYRPIGGHIGALIINDGKFTVWYPDSEKIRLKLKIEKGE